jgi:hypothetical protein
MEDMRKLLVKVKADAKKPWRRVKAQAGHRRPSAAIFAPGVANIVSRGMDTVGQGAVFIKG